MCRKPVVQLIGQDGNVFNLVGICSRALKKAVRFEEARTMQERVFKTGNYTEALSIMGEYVEIVNEFAAILDVLLPWAMLVLFKEIERTGGVTKGPTEFNPLLFASKALAL